jgi:hypothetical protein
LKTENALKFAPKYFFALKTASRCRERFGIGYG